jgi:type VI secretion system protein ImpH
MRNEPNDPVPGQAAPSEAQARRARLFEDLARQPWAHDFFNVMRQVESLSPGMPRLGAALRPVAEPLRLGQEPELDFAPAALASFQTNRAVPRLGVRFFGLFGPMGPLPLHLTEYTRDRLRNHADPTLARFADVFHHRALLLFYRAWAQAQPAVQADRPDDDRFAKWVSALFGQAPAALRNADSVPDAAKRFVAGHLSRPTRNAESIVKVLGQYFGVPVRVEPYVGHWMPLRPDDFTRLGSAGRRRSAPLGVSAVAGQKVWDRQYKLRLHIGPLGFDQYRRFLPGQPSLTELRDWMRQLVGFELVWDLRLALRGAEVPPLRLGRGGHPGVQLGRSTWLGRRSPHPDRADLLLRPAHDTPSAASSRSSQSPFPPSPSSGESRHG